MRSTQQISVTVPREMAATIKAKVASGEYASESEVVRDGLRALQARDRAVENWLRTDVVKVYDAVKEHPERRRSIEDVQASLAAQRDRLASRG